MLRNLIKRFFQTFSTSDIAMSNNRNLQTHNSFFPLWIKLLLLFGSFAGRFGRYSDVMVTNRGTRPSIERRAMTRRRERSRGMTDSRAMTHG